MNKEQIELAERNIEIIVSLMDLLGVDDCEELTAKVESLKSFVRDVFEVSEWPEFNSIGGEDLQEVAIKHGLLVSETRYAPCGDICICAECFTDEEFSRGQSCYRLADWLAEKPKDSQ